MGTGITSKPNIEFNQRFGVKHLTASIGGGRASGASGANGAWNLDRLKEMRDECDRAGMVFESIRMDGNFIRTPPGDARERQLDVIVANVQKAAAIGVKFISYHLTMIPIDRNGQRPVRGGATGASFRLPADWRKLPVGAAGVVSADDYWERITHFLQKVVPVCEQVHVPLAVHPYDPPGLPAGYRGVDNWDEPDVFAALKRYLSIVDSPCNALQLCLGTVAEGLDKPREQILPIVRYFAERGKILQIHMRNIRGGRGDFVETYVDDGEMDFFEVIRILRDTGFSGSYLPDHNPVHPDDPGKFQAYAFAYGYINALIHAANAELG
jgi:mannonate dehydratase